MFGDGGRRELTMTTSKTMTKMLVGMGGSRFLIIPCRLLHSSYEAQAEEIIVDLRHECHGEVMTPMANDVRPLVWFLSWP